MKWIVFSLVVGVQVLAFQFFFGIMTRTLPDYLVGKVDLPEATAARVGEFKRRAGRLRFAIGAILLLLIVLLVCIRCSMHVKMLSLSAVSLISSVSLILGYVHDRRTIAAIAGDLPETRQRLASLEKRSLSQHYSPLLEAIPASLLLLTISLAAIGSVNGNANAGDLWFLPIMQAVTLAALLWLTFRNVRTGSCYSPRVRAFHGPPENLLAMERAVLGLELRHLLACRIGLGLWSAMSEAGRYVSPSNRHLGDALIALGWIPLAGILALLPFYSIAASRISRRFSDPAASSNHSTAGDGGYRS